MTRIKRPDRFQVSNSLVVATLVLCLNVLVSDYSQDDAYITYRYADNLATQGTLSFNAGDTAGPAGFSNPGFVLVLALARILSFHLVPLEWISRLVASGAVAMFAFFLLASLTARKPPSPLGCTAAGGGGVLLLFLGFPFTLPNFFCGLETPAYIALIFILWATIFNLVHLSNALERVVVLCLVSLRYDAIVVALPMLLVYSLIDPAKRQDRITNTLLSILSILCFFMVQRLMTESSLMLSFQHKINDFSWDTLSAYLKFSAYTLGVPLVIMLYLRPFVAICAGLHTLYVCLFYSYFAPWHFHRYIFPFVFAFFVFFLVVVAPKKNYGRLAYLIAGFVPMALLWQQLCLGYAFISGYRVLMHTRQALAALMVEAALPVQLRVFAGYDAGALPYLSRWKFIDLLGLTTADISIATPQQVLNQQNPTLLIVSQFEECDPAQVQIWKNRRVIYDTIPTNYYFIKYLRLTNPYFLPDLPYGYYLYANENAPPAFTTAISNLAIDANKSLGYQRFFLRKLMHTPP